MAVPFTVPEIPKEYSSGSDEGVVFGLRVRNGSYVSKESVLFSAEFDKFVLEATPPNPGRVTNLSVTEGSKIKSGEVLFEVDITAKPPWYLRLSTAHWSAIAFVAGIMATLAALLMFGKF